MLFYHQDVKHVFNASSLSIETKSQILGEFFFIVSTFLDKSETTQKRHTVYPNLQIFHTPYGQIRSSESTALKVNNFLLMDILMNKKKTLPILDLLLQKIITFIPLEMLLGMNLHSKWALLLSPRLILVISVGARTSRGATHSVQKVEVSRIKFGLQTAMRWRIMKVLFSECRIMCEGL